MHRMRAVLLGSVAALAFWAALPPADARDFGSGQAPLSIEGSDRFALGDGEELVIEGVYKGAGASTLIVRVDDEWGPSEEQRYEGEFRIEPGPFEIKISPMKMIAPDGGRIQLDKLTRIVVFSYDDANTTITRLASAAPSPEESAQDLLPPRSLPIDVAPAAPLDLSDAGEIVIEGVYEGAEDTVMVLRVDDTDAPGYGDRFNGEYAIAPGPFQIVTPLSAMATPAGRKLNLAAIRRILVSSEDNAAFKISRFVTIAAGEQLTQATPAAPAPTPQRAALQPYDFGTGAAPIEHGYYGDTLDLSAYDEIVVEGVARTNGGLWLILRIDDADSSDYATRFNLELELTPGPFKVRQALGGLRTPAGDLVDPGNIRLIVAHPYGDDDADGIDITRFEARVSDKLPGGAIGYAFGHPDAALPPGFERIGPQDPRLIGEPYVTIRPTPDPLVANGVKGVRIVRLDVPPGEYRVTIWGEDPGEWEYLPHPLRRVILVNGEPLRRTELGRDQWIADRYLRGLKFEHTPEDDAYSAYGRHRGEPHAIDVTVAGDEGLRIEIGGDNEDARHLSAVLIEPIEAAGQAYQAVEAARADWYRQYWRLDPEWRADSALDAPAEAQLMLGDGAPQLTGPDGEPISAISGVGAPGTGVRVTLAATAAEQIEASAKIIAPSLDGVALEASLWTGQWRLERRRPADTLLSLADNTLLPTGDASIPADRPRRYEMWFDAPDDAKPGVYLGSLEIMTAEGPTSLPIAIEILDVQLPAATEPAGFYLTEAPHLTWFSGEPFERQRQAACDVRFMVKMDLRGSAPAVRPPQPGSTVATALDLQLPFDLGLTPPWVAYNPIRPLQFDFTPENGAKLVADVEAQLKSAGAPPPMWSVADELSNPGDSASKDFWPWVKALRAAAPGIKLAGHLNNEDDRVYLDAFDTVILNAGFGLDPEILAEMKGRGLGVWIYNTFTPRVTAGYWLWATSAEGYVQWHGRMPTADPFDPIDGREGDVQAILPSAEVCPPLPGVHRDTLRLAEGVVDQRWLLWLDAQTGPEAEALREKLRARASDGFKAAERSGDGAMAQIRADIIALARR